jgi:hypothetical protein
LFAAGAASLLFARHPLLFACSLPTAVCLLPPLLLPLYDAVSFLLMLSPTAYLPLLLLPPASCLPPTCLSLYFSPCLRYYLLLLPLLLPLPAAAALTSLCPLLCFYFFAPWLFFFGNLGLLLP